MRECGKSAKARRPEPDAQAVSVPERSGSVLKCIQSIMGICTPAGRLERKSPRCSLLPNAPRRSREPSQPAPLAVSRP